ncbi:hypothetical protein IW15_09540 [Chryseobacterium soli]|uniref:Bacteriocin n=1 Tax=Chryseobacterium soli TaxID=445961 RepID=A0A086A8J4_9FLAO|nr:hypothetical protein [Chryseobacterium soli]KFF13008.1 hypothetical protein IW15_09540 [Chryseobacterium soli]
MKNLKKLSRNELKKMSGGANPFEESAEVGNCGDACTPGNNDTCKDYGLQCGIYMLSSGGTVTSSCWKCM